MTEISNSGVFNVDINRLANLLNKNVKIKVKNVVPEIYGQIFTIDPVSENIVLLKKDEGTVMIILKHAVEEITVLDTQGGFTESEMTNLFSNTLPTGHQGCDKQHLLDWLTSTKIPFSLQEDSVDIEGVLIQPPYTPHSCISNNPVKLSRIQNLLKNMPVNKKKL